MEFAPPENDVPDGDPIPIDTKYGIRYTVPGDWQFQRGGVKGWENDEESLRFGDFAEFQYDYCPEFRDGVSKASTGITGRSGVDVQTAALEVSRRTEIIFRERTSGHHRLEPEQGVGAALHRAGLRAFVT